MPGSWTTRTGCARPESRCLEEFIKWLGQAGNGDLIMPALVGCTLLLAVQSPDGKRPALLWLLATLSAGLVVAVTKLAHFGWGTGIQALDLNVASGHATAAMAFWPVFMALLTPARTPRMRPWLALAGALIAIACGVSLTVGLTPAHPPIEIAAGLALGGAIASAMLASLRGRYLVAWQVAGVAVLFAVSAWFMPYRDINKTQMLARLGTWMACQLASERCVAPANVDAQG